MSRVNAKVDDPPKGYEELVEWFLPRPVQDNVDYENTMEAIDELMVLRRPTKGQRDYLKMLATLVEAYERPYDFNTLSDPIEILEFLLKENDMSGSDLGRLLGSRQLGPAILRGARNLSKTHIKKLATHFKVDAGLFI